jgi:hypothetical protein
VVYSPDAGKRCRDSLPFLQAHPEELRHPSRQIEGCNVAGHVEQLQAKERHDVAYDDYDQEHLRRDPEGCARRDLGGQDIGDLSAVEFGHVALGQYFPQKRRRQSSQPAHPATRRR